MEHQPNIEEYKPQPKFLGFTLSPHIGIGKSLLIWFLAISFIPLATVSYINYRNAFVGLSIVAEKALNSSSQLRVEYINSYFRELEKDLVMQSTLERNINYLQQLTEAFEQSAAHTGMRNVQQKLTYLISSRYDEFKEISQIKGFHDILFLDRNLNILFSLRPESGVGENLREGVFAGTLYGQAAAQAFATESVLFSDFDFYPAADSTAIGMFIQPIFSDAGAVLGGLAILITTDHINYIIHDDIGFGKTGVSYLLGEDQRMRSATRFDPKNVILRKKVTHRNATEWAQRIRALRAGLLTTADITNEQKVLAYPVNDSVWVYGIHRNIESLMPFGVHWALFEELAHQEAFAYARQLARTVTISLLITLMVVLIISTVVAKRFVNPIKELSAWAKQVARGELIRKNIRAPKNEVGEMQTSFNKMVESIRDVAQVAQNMAIGDYSNYVAVKSQHDVMAMSMNQMIDSFRNVVQQANSISHGDYSATIKPRSGKDTLGIALFNMTKTLRETLLEIKRQDYLKSGLTKLNEKISGKRDLNELSQEIINFITQYLECKIGLLYLMEDNGFLQIRASFALADRKGRFRKFEPGEGLVGQAAKGRQIIEFSNTSDKTPAVNYGIDETIPPYYLFIPCYYETTLVGVIQIGSTQPFDEHQKHFCEICTETIGTAINAARSHTRLQKLLAQTQDQKEKLQVQQEELRQTNEELEEQTRALKNSEEVLQAQKEELSVINEELEERTKALEREKENIRTKNEELRLAQAEIEKKAGDLEMVNRFKSEFLANMSHELRTPLNSILVLSQLLLGNAKGNLDLKQVEYARTIHSSGSDLMSLINEILDLSKVESGKLDMNIDKLHFSHFREDIEKTFTPLVLNKRLRLLIDIEQKLPPHMLTDRQRVFQVIKNLISNAIKFTEKGEVELKIYRPSPELHLTRPGLKANECIAFAVRDTGTGIPKEKFKLIFEAFQQADGTTNRKYGGTGLGLSISKNFSELLGGEIHVESEIGKGSTFTMYLPETYTPRQNVEKPGEIQEIKPTQMPDAPKPVIGSKKLETIHTLPEDLHDDRDTILKGDRFILVIEDDVSFLRVLYDLAHEKGFKCLLATDGESGLYFADYYGPSAIILDVGLPCIDGFEVMTRLKANPHTRHIPVHFITAGDKGAEAFKMGAVGYLTKPVSTESLQQVFNKLQEVITSTSKRILVVDDEEIIRRSLVSLLSGKDVEIKAVAGGNEAFELLKSERFDGIVLDLGLEDISGADLLEKVRQEKELANIPVFIYTGKELTKEEENRLSKHADSIIIKGARSPERLLAETTLFLHRIKAVMPPEKQEMLEAVFNRDAVFQNRKVLIVDDDMRNVFALTNVLEDCGLKVIVGRNGREGLDLLHKNKDVDLVLMDIMMPEMDGYETMHAIRKDTKYAKLPIIALTAKAMKDDREKCIRAGANEYLSKPFDKDKLLSLLRVWLYR